MCVCVCIHCINCMIVLYGCNNVSVWFCLDCRAKMLHWMCNTHISTSRMRLDDTVPAAWGHVTCSYAIIACRAPEDHPGPSWHDWGLHGWNLNLVQTRHWTSKSDYWRCRSIEHSSRRITRAHKPPQKTQTSRTHSAQVAKKTHSPNPPSEVTRINLGFLRPHNKPGWNELSAHSKSSFLCSHKINIDSAGIKMFVFLKAAVVVFSCLVAAFNQSALKPPLQKRGVVCQQNYKQWDLEHTPRERLRKYFGPHVLKTLKQNAQQGTEVHLRFHYGLPTHSCDADLHSCDWLFAVVPTKIAMDFYNLLDESAQLRKALWKLDTLTAIFHLFYRSETEDFAHPRGEMTFCFWAFLFCPT